MASIPAFPTPQKNLVLTIGTDSYEQHVSSVAFVPSQSSIEWKGGTPDAVFTDVSSPSWVCNVTAVQDWNTPDSLFNYLLDNEGAQATVTYKPDAAGTFGITSEITLVAPQIGGAVNAYNEATLSFGSTKPARIAVPATV